MIYTIKNDTLECRISTLGAELISLCSNNEEYMWQGEQWKHHAPVLFPIIGRLRDKKYLHDGKEYNMGLHGFARDLEFETVEHSGEHLLLLLRSNEETRHNYPFDFELYAEYTLSGDTLEAKYTVKNTGEGELIYMFGWHPAFRLMGDAPISSYTLDFDAAALTKLPLTEDIWYSGILEFYPLEDKKYRINEEEIYSEDTLIFTDTAGRVRLSSDLDPHALTITYSDNLPYLALWKMPDSEARYICIEPWTGIVGGGEAEVLREKCVKTLDKGEEESFVYTVKCK